MKARSSIRAWLTRPPAFRMTICIARFELGKLAGSVRGSRQVMTRASRLGRDGSAFVGSGRGKVLVAFQERVEVGHDVSFGGFSPLRIVARRLGGCGRSRACSLAQSSAKSATSAQPGWPRVKWVRPGNPQYCPVAPSPRPSWLWLCRSMPGWRPWRRSASRAFAADAERAFQRSGRVASDKRGAHRSSNRRRRAVIVAGSAIGGTGRTILSIVGDVPWRRERSTCACSRRLLGLDFIGGRREPSRGRRACHESPPVLLKRYRDAGRGILSARRACSRAAS